ncbi:MAG: hypothetical protein CBE00_13360 [Planctomycetaceae bacterium TMED240]|nr:MAG: hypothetical protein CBE00_13360 [Planctomycetaceae bacterium TMED240]
MKTVYRPDSNFRNNRIVNGKYLSITDELVSNKADVVTSPLIVEAKYDQRPDVLANDLYGNSRLWWVFAEFNQDKLVDPILDLKAGMELQVPEKFS